MYIDLVIERVEVDLAVGRKGQRGWQGWRRGGREAILAVAAVALLGQGASAHSVNFIFRLPAETLVEHLVVVAGISTLVDPLELVISTVELAVEQLIVRKVKFVVVDEILSILSLSIDACHGSIVARSSVRISHAPAP